MRTYLILLIIGLFLFVTNSDLQSQEPKVFNVQFSQRADSKVEVTYDLVGNPSKKYSVKLSLRKSGARGELPISRNSVTGTIGENISPGRGLRIIWNLPKDFPKGLEGEGFVFIVEVYERRGGSKLPWIIAGLAAAAGGGAAYLLLGKDSSPKTGSIIIDVPGN